jgi:hypothetical protein
MCSQRGVCVVVCVWRMHDAYLLCVLAGSAEPFQQWMAAATLLGNLVRSTSRMCACALVRVCMCLLVFSPYD